MKEKNSHERRDYEVVADAPQSLSKGKRLKYLISPLRVNAGLSLNC